MWLVFSFGGEVWGVGRRRVRTGPGGVEDVGGVVVGEVGDNDCDQGD